MAVYKEKQREKYATIGDSSYPIGDEAHAKAALARINQGNLSESQKAKVRSKAHAMLERHKSMTGKK
jgi:hypothetical protein